MASTALHLAYTFSDYVRFERDAKDKHEFVGGIILAMAGGTIEHGALCAAVLGILRQQLGGRRCRTYDSNARVRVAATGNAYYPDASVVCGTLQVDSSDQFSILNPIVLVEVLSPTTAAYDTTNKLIDCLTIPSLRHVGHVHHDARRISVHTRLGPSQTFAASTFGAGETAPLTEIDAALSVDEVYFDPLRS